MGVQVHTRMHTGYFLTICYLPHSLVSQGTILEVRSQVQVIVITFYPRSLSDVYLIHKQLLRLFSDGYNCFLNSLSGVKFGVESESEAMFEVQARSVEPEAGIQMTISENVHPEYI